MKISYYGCLVGVGQPELGTREETAHKIMMYRIDIEGKIDALFDV